MTIISEPVTTSAPASIELTSLMLAADQEWMQHAGCASTDPEAFFPEKGGSAREAKKICNRCPVRAECLDWALQADERFGIWGGLSERERRTLNSLTEGVTE